MQVIREAVRPNGPKEQAGRGLKIVSHVGEGLNRLLEAHLSAPTIDIPPDGTPRWVLPEDTDVLITTPLGWKGAPSVRPADWPQKLKWIQTDSVGIDSFPKWMFENVTVTCARGFNAPSIAEYVMATILAFEKRLIENTISGAAEWRALPMGSLEGRTLGIAGFGSIGNAIASRAQAFGMRIQALRRSNWNKFPLGIEPVVHITELLSRSDHLVLAMPCTEATRYIINPDTLASAKRGLHLINVARGGLIEQEALLTALDDGRVARASLDVTEPEPLPEGHPFYQHPKIRLTPHIAWDGDGNYARLATIIMKNMDAFTSGDQLSNVVDVALGY